MKHTVQIIVVVPIGPNSPAAFIADTIESFIFYTGSTYKIILADDSRQQVGEQVKHFFPDVDILYTTKPMGSMSGLYINLAYAYKYALEHYHFDMILKLDTDALIINREPEKEALQLFKDEPDIGIAGQYPNEYSGEKWDRGWPRQRILNGVFTWKFIRRPFINITLKKLFIKAIDNGYKPGESVFGGAYYISKNALVKLDDDGLLPYNKLKNLNLGEDHLFALLVKSLGFHLGDLSSNSLPFACAWKGLPAAPEELYFNKKKIIHSVRHWDKMNEQEIRTYYKEKRRQSLMGNSVPKSAGNLKVV